MKRLFTLLVVTLFVSLLTCAQEFVAPTKLRSSVVFTDTTTTYTYKMPDKTYNVYKSKNSAFYIWKISKKTNKPYKMYLPKEVQIQMGRKYEDK